MAGTPEFTFTPDIASNLLTLYTQKRYDEVSTSLLSILRTLKVSFLRISAETQAQVDDFVGNLLFLMSRPDYRISDSQAGEFIQHNPLIANVVALSSFKTTDAWLAMVGRQSNNLARLLTLYSARNTMRIDRKKLFDANPNLASLWYTAFMAGYNSMISDENAVAHLQEHMAGLDPRFTYLNDFHYLCFAVSYIDPTRDHLVKQHVNRLIQERLQAAEVVVKNQPNPRRIAVLTNRWFRGHSVCRNQYTWLEAVAKDYELVLVHLGPTRPDTDMALFREIRHVQMDQDHVSIGEISTNEFGMAYYPEVGMCMESIFLSNMRLAPIQISSYGHSVSTFGSHIDYWIGGADVELKGRLEENYSERVVLLPGLGIANLRPNYTRRGTTPRTDRIVVNCSWYPQKVGFPFLRMIRQILERCPPSVLLRFYSGGGLQDNNHFLPFARSVVHTLGTKHVEIVPGLPYEAYMSSMEEGALSLDSYPYGGCNTVVDSLHLRRPIVTLMGTRWNNRIGGGILRQAGMPDLVAETPEDFIDLAVRLISDPAWRTEMTERLEAIDIDARLYARPQDGAAFRHAIDYLFANHERLQAEELRTPIDLAPTGLQSPYGDA